MWVVYTPFKKSLFVVNVKGKAVYVDENVPNILLSKNRTFSVRFVDVGLSSCFPHLKY